MIIKCKKQFIALFMAISVIFCVGSETYIKAEALEWAIPTITAGEAIKWLLGLLGVTVAGGALANTDYDKLVENYNDFAEIKGQTAVDTGKFWADIIDGSLDTGSKAWATFKEWVQTLPQKITANLNSYTLDEFTSSFGITTLRNPQNLDILGFKFSAIYIPADFAVGAPEFRLYDVNRISISGSYVTIFYNKRISLTRYDQYDNSVYTVNRVEYNVSDNYINSSSGLLWLANYLYSGLTTSIKIPSFEFPLKANGFNKYMDNVNDIGLIVSKAISDAIPDVIPLPWDQVAGTAEGINDKIDELIEKVNTGVMSLDEYMAAVQSILGVIAFDTTNDLVIPTNPDLPDETIKDKVNENVNNNGFVLTGLENFFPFCIPFDIYSFITILVAEPVAPVIHWHIYNPVTKSDNIITLDFSVWEPIVILFRYIFDFLFIIGLAMIARSLIGGDD